ncbi:hypothetical protein M3223_04160 [Paenibacillus pasadenensis]|uniref:hypothetical protein n=1 Tax=Paenibacillus pasadenensis TaxID=217090 RepID=UPI00203AB8FC|nr:hypothetical protein [Paenibacillus pasadenensis]MCM3746543.1 hypothetical protein [Paenibacillus pasadenensis]
MFDLKRTCPDCPFIEGSSTNQTLRPERIKGIKMDLLQGRTFSCHKTVNYDSTTNKEEQHCVGAMLWLYKRDRPNQMMRIAERIGGLRAENLSTHGQIIE